MLYTNALSTLKQQVLPVWHASDNMTNILCKWVRFAASLRYHKVVLWYSIHPTAVAHLHIVVKSISFFDCVHLDGNPCSIAVGGTASGISSLLKKRYMYVRLSLTRSKPKNWPLYEIWVQHPMRLSSFRGLDRQCGRSHGNWEGPWGS